MPKVAYDLTLMRPGCVLIAAGLRADTNAANQFDSKHWLVQSTPDMKIYETSPEQLEILIAKTNSFHEGIKNA